MSKVTNSKGVVTLRGHEDKVREFIVNHEFAKRLQSILAEGKQFFCSLAKETSDGATGKLKKVEFVSDKGVVPVTMPDMEKTTSRLTVKPNMLTEAIAGGLDLEEEGMIEREETYVLKGAFVKWMDDVLNTQYVSKGLEIPADVEKKTTERLSVKAIEQLKEYAKTNQDSKGEIANKLLNCAIKSPTVSVK